VRLLVVSNGFPPRGQWGTEYYTHELVSGLVKRGHEVAVMHPERDGSKPRYTLERAEGSGGVRVFLLHNEGDRDKSFVESYQDTKVDECFRSVLKEWKPDVVHFTYLLWGLSVRMPVVCLEEKVPTVVTLTDYSLACHRGQMFDWTMKRCFGPHPPEVCARCIREPGRYDGSRMELAAKRTAVRSLAAVGGVGRVAMPRDLEKREIAVRNAIRTVGHLITPTVVIGEAFHKLGVPLNRITRLCYGFDPSELEVARPEPDSKMIRFGFLGQFTPHKGLASLLKAVEILSCRLPESVEPWEVLLYGRATGGRNREYAIDLFSKDRGPRVRVEKPFPPLECGRILKTLNAVVVPSEWDENAPLTVLQARAAGVPIIACDVPGIREVLEDGVHGKLCPVGDSMALANAMREVILRKMKRTERFDLPVTLTEHLDRIEEIYSTVELVAPVTVE
jgi:glycosyltransferase involved in cell wall biosynthesis